MTIHNSEFTIQNSADGAAPRLPMMVADLLARRNIAKANAITQLGIMSGLELQLRHLLLTLTPAELCQLCGHIEAQDEELIDACAQHLAIGQDTAEEAKEAHRG